MATRNRPKDAWSGLLSEWRSSGHPDELAAAEAVDAVLRRGVAGRKSPAVVAQQLSRARQAVTDTLNQCIADTARLTSGLKAGPTELVITAESNLDDLRRMLADIGIDLQVDPAVTLGIVRDSASQPAVLGAQSGEGISAPVILTNAQDVQAFVELLLQHQSTLMDQGFDPYADFFSDDGEEDSVALDADIIASLEELPVSPELAALEDALAGLFGPVSLGHSSDEPAPADPDCLVTASQVAPVPTPAPAPALAPASAAPESSGPLGQEDLDALLREMTGGATPSTPALAPAPAPAPAPAAPESNGPLGQADLDALLREMTGGATPSTPAPAPPEPAPTPASAAPVSNGPLGQGDLDALLREMTMASAAPTAETQSQDEIVDEIPVSATDSVVVTAAHATTGPLGQGDLDDLLKDLATSTADAIAADANPQESDPVPAEVAPASSDFNALLAEFGGAAEASLLVDAVDLSLTTTGQQAEAAPETAAPELTVVDGGALEAVPVDPSIEVLRRLDTLLGWVEEAQAEEPDTEPVFVPAPKEELPAIDAKIYAAARCAPLRLEEGDLICLAVEPINPELAAAIARAAKLPLRLVASPEATVAARWTEVFEKPWPEANAPAGGEPAKEARRIDISGLVKGVVSRFRKSA